MNAKRRCTGSGNCLQCGWVGSSPAKVQRNGYRARGPSLPSALTKRGGGLGLLLSAFLNLASGNPAEHDGSADHVGGALLASGPLGIIFLLVLCSPVLSFRGKLVEIGL